MSLSKYSGKKANQPMCAVKIYLKMGCKEQAMVRCEGIRLPFNLKSNKKPSTREGFKLFGKRIICFFSGLDVEQVL
jgi:hypothetical protein